MYVLLITRKTPLQSRANTIKSIKIHVHVSKVFRYA